MKINRVRFDISVGRNKPENILNKENACPFCHPEGLTDILSTDEGGIILLKNKYNVLTDADQFVLIETDRCGVGYYNTMLQNILLGHNQVMNRALLEKLTERQPDLRKIYAHDLWITETASVFGTILFDNEPHTLYRQHRENELGFGTGPLNWILMRIRRAVGGEIEEILRQRNYFLSFYNKDIPKPLKHEMVRYMRARSTFATRTVYALRTRLFRQKTFETVLFKILYIAGIYH